MKGHSVCRGGKTLHVGRKAPDAREKALDAREKAPDAGGKAPHDGGISDDSEIGIIASLWLGKNELTNRIVNIKFINLKSATYRV